MWTFLTLLAAAEPPEAEVVSFSASSSSVTQGACDERGELCAFVSGGRAIALHVPTWTLATASPCQVRAVAVAEGDPDEVWLGCSDGTVRAETWDGGGLRPVVSGSEPVVVRTELGRVDALYSSGSPPTLSVLGPPTEGGNLQLRRVDVARRALAAGAASFVIDGHQASALADNFMYVVHRDAITSVFNLGAGAPQIVTPSPAAEIVALAPTRVNRSWALDREGGAVYEVLALPPSYATVLPSAPGAQAIAVSRATGDEFALVAYPDQVDVWAMTDGIREGDRPFASFDVGVSARALVVAGSGYTFLGGTDGTLRVLTHRPWVDQVKVLPDRVVPGEAVSVSFRLDRAATWQVVQGGTWNAGGVVLASGSGGPGVVDVDVAGRDWDEGQNQMFVRVTADGVSGHGYASLRADGPPGKVAIDVADVRVDDGYVEVNFDGLNEPDIASYTLYVSTSPFEGKDWPTGGPNYDGTGDVDAPITKSGVAPGEPVSIGVSGLVNGVNCYLAVRATDEGGLEGPMSEVVQAVPSELTGAAGLAGEAGGMDCQAGPSARFGGGASVWLGLMAGVALAARYRAGGRVVAIAVAAMIALVIPSSALAQEDEGNLDDLDLDSPAPEEPTRKEGAAPTFREQLSPWRLRKPENRDLTPVFGHFSVRYGSYEVANPAIVEVYRESADIWQVEVGPQFFQVLELKAGAGFFREVGAAVNVEGQVGAKVAILRALPLSLGGTFRLHVLDEQVLVPYVSGGLDWWIWDERQKNGSTRTDQIWGGKFGHHYALGGQLLLDTLAPGRASMLESQTEINDSWLTFEYRRQVIEGTQGLSFTGNLFTVGLKLDL